MRTLILVAVLVVLCISMTGCWFFDANHNRMHYNVLKEDMRLLHQDWDWITLMEEPSPNDFYYR